MPQCRAGTGKPPKNPFVLFDELYAPNIIYARIGAKLILISLQQLFDEEELQEHDGVVPCPINSDYMIQVDKMGNFSLNVLVFGGVICHLEKKFTSDEHKAADEFLSRVIAHLNLSGQDDSVYVSMLAPRIIQSSL